jgi:Na+/melibiose symporter-like transporter
MVNAVMGIGVLVYSMHLGVSATLIGIALALPRLWDALLIH